MHPVRPNKLLVPLVLTLALASCRPSTFVGQPPGEPARESQARPKDAPTAKARPADQQGERRCKVVGTYRGETLVAEVATTESTVKRSVLRLRATLEGDRVVYRGGVFAREAGIVRDKGGLFLLSEPNIELTPLIEGSTSLTLEHARLSVQSQECTPRQVIFGTLHLAAVYFSHLEADQAMR